MNHNCKLKALNDFSIFHLKICTVNDNYITAWLMACLEQLFANYLPLFKYIITSEVNFYKHTKISLLSLAEWVIKKKICYLVKKHDEFRKLWNCILPFKIYCAWFVHVYPLHKYVGIHKIITYSNCIISGMYFLCSEIFNRKCRPINY